METDRYFEEIASGDATGLRDLLGRDPGLLAARSAPGNGTGLHAAVSADSTEAAATLVEAGIDIEARNDEGRTALHDAIELGRGDILEILLRAGAEVDVCAAAILGHTPRLREILDADPSLANDRTTGLSPLGWAAFGNQLETAEELLERGARMDDGELLCAAAVGHVAVGELLIERGADPDEFHDGPGGNSLHVAVAGPYAQDQRPFVEMLLGRGARTDLRNAKGETALEMAERLARDLPEDPRPFAALADLLRRRS